MRVLILSMGWLGAIVMGFVVWGAIAPAFSPTRAACVRYEPVPPNEPTGIKGCERWGEGLATHYGPGDGAAMNFCTWELRHSEGCGAVRVTSMESGISLIVPIIDYCDCYTGTPREKIIDLQYGVLIRLGVESAESIAEQRTKGVYPVVVSPVDGPVRGLSTLPNTSMMR